MEINSKGLSLTSLYYLLDNTSSDKTVVTMFAFVLYTCSSGRVVPPLAARRSPTDEIKKIGVQ